MASGPELGYWMVTYLRYLSSVMRIHVDTVVHENVRHSDYVIRQLVSYAVRLQQPPGFRLEPSNLQTPLPLKHRSVSRLACIHLIC